MLFFSLKWGKMDLFNIQFYVFAGLLIFNENANLKIGSDNLEGTSQLKVGPPRQLPGGKTKRNFLFLDQATFSLCV